VLGRRVDSPRVLTASQTSANRYAHAVRAASPEDIDEELLAWLREAWELEER